ncbi:MAG: hypothetical protein ACYTE8_05965, partial [Planctomycetota bacterium]
MKFKITTALLITIITYLAFCTATGICQEDNQAVASALNIAKQNANVKDILTDFPDIRMEPRYSEEYGVWIIEFLTDDREVGMASVSLEQEKVLEFEFNINEINDGMQEESELELNPKSFFRRLKPRFEGAAFCWLSLLLVVVFLGDFKRFVSLRNLDILLLYLICPFLLVLWQNRKFSYTAIFVVTFLYFIRCLLQLWNRPKEIAEESTHLRRAA